MSSSPRQPLPPRPPPDGLEWHRDDNRRPPPPSAVGSASARKPEDHAADALLVERCLTNDAMAWRLLYEKFHRGLRSAVRKQLGKPCSNDPDFVEDVLQNVFVALCQKNFRRLRLWRMEVAGLNTFLHAVARQESLKALRTLRRSRVQYQTLAEGRECDPDAFVLAEGGTHVPREWLQEDFLKTLPPRQLEFLTCARNGSAEMLATRYSKASIWKMSQRLRAKWRKFMASHVQTGK